MTFQINNGGGSGPSALAPVVPSSSSSWPPRRSSATYDEDDLDPDTLNSMEASTSSLASSSSSTQRHSRSRSRTQSRSRSRSTTYSRHPQQSASIATSSGKAARKPSTSLSDILPFAMSPTFALSSSSSEDRSRFASRPLFPDDDEDDEDEDEHTGTDPDETEADSQDDANHTVNEDDVRSASSSQSSYPTSSVSGRARRRKSRTGLSSRNPKQRTSSYSISPHSPLGVLLAPLSSSQSSSGRSASSSYSTSSSPFSYDTTATSPDSALGHGRGPMPQHPMSLFNLGSFTPHPRRASDKRNSIENSLSRPNPLHLRRPVGRGAARSYSMSTNQSDCSDCAAAAECDRAGDAEHNGACVCMVRTPSAEGPGPDFRMPASSRSSTDSGRLSSEASPLFAASALRSSTSSLTTNSAMSSFSSPGGWNSGRRGKPGSSTSGSQPPSPLSTPRPTSNMSLPSIAQQSIASHSSTSISSSGITTSSPTTTIFSIPPNRPRSPRTSSGLSTGSSMTSTSITSSFLSGSSGAASNPSPAIPSPLRFLQAKNGPVVSGSPSSTVDSLISSKPAEIIVHATRRGSQDAYQSPAASASARLLRSPVGPGSNGMQRTASGPGPVRSPPTSPNDSSGSPGNSAFSFSSASTVTATNAQPLIGTTSNIASSSMNLPENATMTAATASSQAAQQASSGSQNGLAPSTAGMGHAARARQRSPSHILRRRVFSPSREHARSLLGLGPLADDDNNAGSSGSGSTSRPQSEYSQTMKNRANRGASAERRMSIDAELYPGARRFATEPGGQVQGRRRSSLRAVGDLLGLSSSNASGAEQEEFRGRRGVGPVSGEEEVYAGGDARGRRGSLPGAEEDQRGRGRAPRDDSSAAGTATQEFDRESYAARIYNIQQQMGGRLWSRFALGSQAPPSPGITAPATSDSGGSSAFQQRSSTFSPGYSISTNTGGGSGGNGAPPSGGVVSRGLRAPSPKRSLGSLLGSSAISSMPAPRLTRTASVTSSTGSVLSSSASSIKSRESGQSGASSAGNGRPARQRQHRLGEVAEAAAAAAAVVGEGSSSSGGTVRVVVSPTLTSTSGARRYSHSSRLTSGLRSLVKLPNLLLGTTSPRPEDDASSTFSSSDKDSLHGTGKGSGATAEKAAGSASSSSTSVRKSFAESTRRMSSTSVHSMAGSGRGVVSPWEGDSDPGAYVFGLGLPVDPDTELGSVVQLQTFRTGHGYPFGRSRTLSLDTGAAVARRDGVARTKSDDTEVGPLDIDPRADDGSKSGPIRAGRASSQTREPPNVHRGSVPEGKEAVEIMSRKRVREPQMLSSPKNSTFGEGVEDDGHHNQSQDSLPSFKSASAASQASPAGPTAFWSRPSRPAAEAVPQNYSAFRSRQRAGIRKSKESTDPVTAVASGLAATMQPSNSATNSSASLSAGTSASSEFSADSSSISSHDDERSAVPVIESAERPSRFSLHVRSPSTAANSTRSRSRDPSPPSQHAVGLFSGGGYCSQRRASADGEELSTGMRRSKSGSDFTSRTVRREEAPRHMRGTQSVSALGGRRVRHPSTSPDASASSDGAREAHQSSGHHHSGHESGSTRGRAGTVKSVSGSNSEDEGGRGGSGRSRSRLLSADIWKAAGSIAKPRPPLNPNPARTRASPPRKAKAPTLPPGRLSSPPGFRPRVPARPLPLGGPPPVLPGGGAGLAGAASRTVQAAAAAAAASSSGGLQQGSGRLGAGGVPLSNSGVGGSGSSSNGSSRMSLLSNNKHLLMLSLELEMMRKRKISAPLKPRAFVVKWVQQQQYEETVSVEEDQQDQGSLGDDGEDEHGADEAEDETGPSRRYSISSNGASHNSNMHSTLLAGGSSLRYEVQLDTLSRSA
ncbi:hypothetical protein OC845_001903 [Tilletia horrida]|nr:hypothetical protein OC845_001903 [Tilletia horrida]